MPPPQQVLDWVKQAYPKPVVDPDWIEACYEWLESEFHLDPNTQLDQILSRLESQLLDSDLSTSMRAKTGLPPNVSKLDNMTLRGPPILVQVVSMTEIGSSAFNLQNIRQARIEEADLAGLAEEEEDEEAPKIPKYPRGMLKFELNDGKTTMQAIEYKRLDGLELGVTPLGFKMQLKNVFIRRGIAFLEPGSVILKHHQTEELQAVADEAFMHGLQLRMGKPPGDPAPPPPQNAPAQNNNQVVAQPAPVPARAPSAAAAAVVPHPQSPVAAPPRPPPPTLPEALAPTPSSSNTLVGSTPTLARSKFFDPPANPPNSNKGKERAHEPEPEPDLRRVLRLSPHRASPILYPDSDEEMRDTGAEADVAMRDDGSSDYDWGDFDDNELVATLEETEQVLGRQSTGPLSSSTVSGASKVANASTAVTSTRSATKIKREAEATRLPSAGPAPDAIYISDSDEKENVPNPPRKRRHIDIPEEDIISISD